MCCTRLAENTGRKNDAKNRHLGTVAQLCRAISSQLRYVSTIHSVSLVTTLQQSTYTRSARFARSASVFFAVGWSSGRAALWSEVPTHRTVRTLAALVNSKFSLARTSYVISAGWQVTLCDPIWHVSSSSGEACCELLYPVTLLTTTTIGSRVSVCVCVCVVSDP